MAESGSRHIVVDAGDSRETHKMAVASRKMFASDDFKTRHEGNPFCGLIAHSSKAKDVVSEGFFYCYECAKPFSGWTEYMSHKTKKHGYRNPAFFQVRTPHCLCCNKLFHSIQRVVRHITEGSPKCRQYYDDNVDRLEAGQFDTILKLDYYTDRHLVKSRQFRKPCFQL